MGNINISKGKAGQSLVETALILPLIILILMGIIDFGLLFNDYLIISNASREAARSATIGETDDNIRLSISNQTTTLEQDKMTIIITPEHSIRKKGDEVSITISYNHSLITPIISSLIPNPVNLTSQTVMRVE